MNELPDEKNLLIAAKPQPIYLFAAPIN